MIETTSETRTHKRPAIHAPRGTELNCKGWEQEAALRMLMNNLDPDVAERPEELIVYGGSGKAARNWECYDAIVATLKRLGNDETLLVQSGKPVAVFPTHEGAPRVLIANSLLVPHWATDEEFRRLDGLGPDDVRPDDGWILDLHRLARASCRVPIETLAECARQSFGGSLAGTLTVTAGLGGMGGAQPLAVTMNDGVCLIAEVERHRIDRRLETRYLDRVALRPGDRRRYGAWRRRPTGERVSIAVEANAVDLLEHLLERGVTPEILTDQTSAHDNLTGYVPHGMSYDEALALRESDPEGYVARAMTSMAAHVRAMLALQERGALDLRLRQQPARSGTSGRGRQRVRLRGFRAPVYPSSVL